MLKSEFENLTGSKLSDEAYKTAERIYMASTIEKEEFCKAWKDLTPIALKLVEDLAKCANKSESQNAVMRSVGKILVEQCSAESCNCEVIRAQALELLGRRAYTKFCLEEGYSLTSDDRRYLLDLIETTK